MNEKERWGGRMEHTAASTHGPVNALDNAIRKAPGGNFIPSCMAWNRWTIKCGASVNPETLGTNGERWVFRRTSSKTAGRLWWIQSTISC